MKFPKKKPCHR
ncbi:hypothetical protein LINPERHAP2_LOCUS23673 [Linum perenne]